MAKNYISNKDETPRMFESDLLEAFSKVHFTVPLYIYMPIIVLMLYLSIAIYKLMFLTIVLLFVLGLFIWSFAEYSLHRFVFHFVPKNEIGARLHFIFHGVHHDYPNDSKRLVMPPSVSLPLATLFYFLFLWILGKIWLPSFFAGFLTGYLFYDMTHYAIHHFNMHNKFWLAIKNHHMRHHYQNPYKGFGVSSRVWDFVIGTDFPDKSK